MRLHQRSWILGLWWMLYMWPLGHTLSCFGCISRTVATARSGRRPSAFASMWLARLRCGLLLLWHAIPRCLTHPLPALDCQNEAMLQGSLSLWFISNGQPHSSGIYTFTPQNHVVFQHVKGLLVCAYIILMLLVVISLYGRSPRPEVWKPIVPVPQMSFGHCVFYYWSDEEWDSCDKFREVATPILNPNEAPDLLEWRASDTQVYIKGRQTTMHRLINIQRRDVYGACPLPDATAVHELCHMQHTWWHALANLGDCQAWWHLPVVLVRPAWQCGTCLSYLPGCASQIRPGQRPLQTAVAQKGASTASGVLSKQ